MSLLAFAAVAYLTIVALELVIAGSLWLTRRALRPLEEVVETAGRMTARDLSQRLSANAGDDELIALVSALNGLFARLEAGFGALGRFAAEASHELRTPLAAIAAELEVALARPRSPTEWEASARDALDEVRRLTRLVEALLEMARAEGTPMAPTTPVDLRSVVDRVVSGLASSAQSAGVELIAPACEQEARVDGNAEALASAIANLVDNAVRYTPRGGRVDVTLLRRGPSVLLVVDDTGPGVEGAQSDAIFGPFERGAAGPSGDELRAGAGRGAGLGLTIARRILEHHRGRVTVGASPAAGARFTVELPGSLPSS